MQIGRGVRQGCCLSPILYNLYSECLTKKVLDFNIRGQIIQTVKYADDLVLMAKEETVLRGMIDKLPYFSIDNARALSIQKRFKFVKNEHARYTLERYER